MFLRIGGDSLGDTGDRVSFVDFDDTKGEILPCTSGDYGMTCKRDLCRLLLTRYLHQKPESCKMLQLLNDG